MTHGLCKASKHYQHLSVCLAIFQINLFFIFELKFPVFISIGANNHGNANRQHK